MRQERSQRAQAGPVAEKGTVVGKTSPPVLEKCSAAAPVAKATDLGAAAIVPSTEAVGEAEISEPVRGMDAEDLEAAAQPVRGAKESTPAVAQAGSNVSNVVVAPMRKAKVSEPDMTPAFALRSFAIGALGGFLSSVGGLGGPIVLMPLYLQFMPPIDMKLMIGIINPTASSLILASVAGALMWGSPDVGLAMALTPVMVTANLLGGYLQRKISSEKLKPLVCAVLLVFGLFIIGQVVMKLL